MTNRATEATKVRLREESEQIESLKRSLAAASRRRRLLVLKLSTSGLSERAIGVEASISGSAVHQMLPVARREYLQLCCREA